jgi:long-chain acyl-CoA synthetase
MNAAELQSEAAPSRFGTPARTLCEAFAHTVERYPDRMALITPDGSSLTWGAYGAQVRQVAAGLHELGLRRGDTFALMLSTRIEFHLLDAAAFMLGAVPFSIYNTAPPQDVAYVLENSGAKLAVVEDHLRDRVAVERILGVSDVPAIRARGATSSFDLDAAARGVRPDDLLTLIYTSGTTGEPKGVEITHANVLFLASAMDSVVHWPEAAALVSYLPMAHVGDRNCSHYWPMIFGSTVTCAADISKVLDVMRDVRVHFVFGMPRLFEKLRAIVERDCDPPTLAAINQARLRASGRDAPEPDQRLLAQVRERYGFDRLKFGFTGGTMTPPDLLAFLHGVGMAVGEIWGMSECTGIATMSPPDAMRIGTAGTPLPGVEVRIADDGELEVRGAGVMRGYRGRADLTAEALHEDGWLRTGDIGEIDADGYVSVVDRKKELIIGSSGKNMAPSRIEARLKEAFPLIGGAVAIGDQRPHNVALISLDPDACTGFAREHGLAGDSPAELCEDPVVREAVEAQIRAANEHLSAPERIKAFTILPAAWLPGGDELTPTMKPRRKVILAKYAAEIERLYDAGDRPTERQRAARRALGVG